MRSDSPAAAIRSRASACCSVDSVIDRTVAPRRGGADRELAPAGADLEHPGAGADAGDVEQPLDLPDLGAGQVAVVVARRRAPDE